LRRRWRAKLLLVLLDAIVRGLERLVLHQHGLYQRIRGVRGAAKSLADHRFGIGIARVVLQCGKPAEQFGHELAFLRCHVVLLGTPFGAGVIWGAQYAREMARA
jgi:hypothetical protein